MRIRRLVKKIIPISLLYRYYSFAKKSYSQVGQDIWVYKEVFQNKRNGFFVDLGSADGLTLNNTFLLEARFNWKGICIEANPDYFKWLKKFRKVKCINICVDEITRTVIFKKDGLTSKMQLIEHSEKEDTYNEKDALIKIKTETLENIFDKNKVPHIIDYLSVDIEGAEYLALKNFPFGKYSFKCITIERPNEELKRILNREGYLTVKEIPDLDVFYVNRRLNP